MSTSYPEIKHHSYVASDVRDERIRQTLALHRGDIPWDCANAEAADQLKLGVLGEEYGEVCKALIEGAPLVDLYGELIQVAAVATAWAEALRAAMGRAA